MAKPTEESFLKDVSQHEMTIQLDNGNHRHLTFKQPGSYNMFFHIVTFPGFLVYAGDMGSFTFRLLTDMFEFFRTDQDDGGKLRINPGYWGEKLEAVDRRSSSGSNSHVEFSEESFRQHVEDDVRAWIECYDLDKSQTRKLRAAVQEDVLSQVGDDEREAREAVRDFGFEIAGHKFEFQDSWEWSCEEFTYRFKWCCYALAWAIRQYDTFHATQQKQAA